MSTPGINILIVEIRIYKNNTGTEKQGTQVQRKVFEGASGKTEKDPDQKWILSP